MSPLGLLQEGEKAEIVERDSGHEHGYQHKHKHGRQLEHVHFHSNGDQICCGRCENCSCPGGVLSKASDHLMNMGLRPGKLIEMITNKGKGPLILKVDESRIALSRGVAMKIYVRRNET